LIIGKGLIANGFRSFEASKKVLIFASGVSNSNEESVSAFHREEVLLHDALKKYCNYIFVYFSSCDVQNIDKRKYFGHKLNMEALVKKEAKQFYIIRLPQVVGQTSNSNTLINYLFNKIKSNGEFSVWKDATRNFIDIDDVAIIVKHIINQDGYLNQVVNVASTVHYYILDIINIIEGVLNKKAIYTVESGGFNLPIDIEPISPVLSQLGLEFKEEYLRKMMRKYYT